MRQSLVVADRVALPDWPRLMSVELAASYLGVSASTFRTWGVAPVEAPGRRVLYDKRSLDIFADRLAGQPLGTSDRARASNDVEAKFLKRYGRE